MMPKSKTTSSAKAARDACDGQLVSITGTRTSRSGKFTVASTAKPPKRFTVEQIREAVRKANEPKQNK
jgi:hypothetical protein